MCFDVVIVVETTDKKEEEENKNISAPIQQTDDVTQTRQTIAQKHRG